MAHSNRTDGQQAGGAFADDQFLAFLEEFDRLMLEASGTALEWLESAPECIRCESQWVLCRAEALRAASGVEAAAEYLAGVLDLDPEFADAHYCLAELEAELGHERKAIEHQIETLRLDSMVDEVAEPATAELIAAIVAEAERTLAELPAQLQVRLANVPVLLQARPSESLVAEGFDARALGLFDGPNLAEGSTGDMVLGPTSITLFANCLLDAFGEDIEELLEQVRVTVLHEVGHYFCLDEDQLCDLGLA